MVGVLSENIAESELADQVSVFTLDVKNNVRTEMIPFCIFYSEFTLTVAFPKSSGISRISGFACNNGYFIGNDERRIKTNAELTDKLCILLLVSGKISKELFSSAFSNRTQ